MTDGDKNSLTDEQKGDRLQELWENGMKLYGARDYAQAVHCFQQAADQGHMESQYHLGLCYGKGLGVRKDPAKACEWYQKAAEQGKIEAQRKMGLYAENGWGIEKDMVIAAGWFQRAAMQGDASAQYRLALCYENGTGVNQNYKKACDWYKKAADQGHTEAKRRLESLPWEVVMVKNILQCCYTNLSKESGGKVVSGWQPVAVSDSIPPDAYRTCVGMQNQDSAIQGTMTNERGGILNLLEICGDGKYLYMIRSQYGMLDRLGRPNMFSHAYIFPWTDDSVLIYPNVFLTIANSNFKSSKEDAEKPYESLERIPAFGMWHALQRSGLTNVTAYLLIRCIYVQMTEERITSPLYILYDGSDLQMRSLLYCIYGLLPHHLRRTLRSACAGGVTERDKNVVFSVNALSQEYFFNPATGENSLLTDKLQKKIDRLGYVDYAARMFIYWGAQNHMTNLSEYDVETDIRQYYKTLNGLAVSLGDATATNELFLKIANQLISNCQPPTFKDEDLRTDICDALRTGAYGSTSMENYIYWMLDEICRRGLELALTDENKRNLLTWLNSPECKKLSAEKKRFQGVIKDWANDCQAC